MKWYQAVIQIDILMMYMQHVHLKMKNPKWNCMLCKKDKEL